jgi:long-chain acyl-CoA synthetase
VSRLTVSESSTAAQAPQARRTIPALWRSGTAEEWQGPVYLVERLGRWEPITREEAAGRVNDLANGLLALGVTKGDAFGILAATRPEWALFDFALATVGGITAPIYATSSPRDCAYVLSHAEAVGVLVEDDAQRAKLDEVRSDIPGVHHVVTFADLDELGARGREFALANPTALDEAVAAVQEEDLYTYIYTSGTTGPPKACMIRHRNYYAMVDVVSGVMAKTGLLSRGDAMLLYLPLAHNFGRLMHLLGPHAGLTLAFCPDPYRVADALPEVRPAVFPSVPRLYEKVHAAVAAKFDEATGARRTLIEWALGVGRRMSACRREGRPVPKSLAVQQRLADRLVYSKVKEPLGGRLRLPISGGAPLSVEIAEFFHALDILILEGYGLTECTSACSVNLPDRFRFGTVGSALPGFEVRVAEDGELLIRSETVFAGYFKDEEATRAVLDDDGWLHTGDVGEIDADGFIRVTDRKKDIIVTAGGKNIPPQNLESELKNSRLISQAIVVGDRRPYVAALITLDTDEIRRWAAAHRIEGDAETLAGRPEVRALVQEAVDEVNRERSPFEQIRRFAVLPRDFTQEAGEVTPTLKLKRRVCQQHFAAEIEQLYRD